MKRLTCEMCGSTDLVKDGGVFVCQSCGCKYSIEEARKMMIEGTVEVSGTVKVDNTALISNYLKMAHNALDADNHEEAESYANKIIELDPQNSTAWHIKGEAAGWQSKANNNRIGEAVTAWLNAIQYAPADTADELRTDISSKFVHLFTAMLHLRVENFAHVQSDDNLNSVLHDVDEMLELMNTLTVTGGVSFNRGEFYEDIAKRMDEGACSAYKDACSDFGPDHSNMAKWQWNNFTAAGDNCIKLLKKALFFCRSSSRGKTICDNLIVIGEAVRDSKSWKFNVNSWHADNYDEDYSFTEGAREVRTNQINEYRESMEFYEADPFVQTLDAVQASRRDDEIARGKAQYWQEHSAEKAELNAESSRLKTAVSEAEAQMKTLPVCAALMRTEAAINDLTQQKRTLGLFKGKEKKALQTQIDSLEDERRQQQTQADKEKAAINDEIAKKNARLREIDEELTRERDRICVPIEGILLPNVVQDGKFTISAQQLADHLASKLPSVYRLNRIDEESCELGEFGHQYRIVFERVVDGEGESTGVLIFCSAESLDSPLRDITVETTSIPGKNIDAKDFTVLVSYLLMSLCAELDQDHAEKLALMLRFAEESTLWSFGNGLRIEYASSLWDMLGIVQLLRSDILIRPALNKAK